MLTLEEARNKYINIDINNPRYIFHGSSKALSEIKPQPPEKNKTNNPEDTMTVIYGSIKINGAIPYSIKINGEYDDWSGEVLLHYFVPPEYDYEVALIHYGEIDDDAAGYIYVLDSSTFTKSNDYQWISTEPQIPIAIIQVYYEEVKDHFYFPHIKKR